MKIPLSDCALQRTTAQTVSVEKGFRFRHRIGPKRHQPAAKRNFFGVPARLSLAIQVRRGYGGGDDRA
ncbi:MAG: hypothetical protein Q8R81_09335 [Novosphingobium sp.]|uniref:hypothetical protein n=1 Tax=Novosphingobium sp. TaxID=1874826 RepID=UPI002732A4CF|nr:hypothetical protein [Novosphingobium sp.]MDP3550587.1 hypothetical protein [Novosphingobium sp.]